MELNSFQQFNRELEQLRKLHKIGSFTFSNTESYLGFQIEQKKIIGDKPLMFRRFAFKETADEVRGYLSKYSSEYLRELIFIRIISALEAFFIDTIRDVFIYTSEPFKNRDSKIEFSVGEILSYDSLDELFNKLLARDRRSLTSGGLSETEKYYNNVFDVDFNNFGINYHSIKEFYDRRHLFIHSLGMAEDGVRILAKTDEQYRARYGTKEKGLDVSDEYLENCMNMVGKFISYVHNELVVKITKPQWKSKKDKDEAKSNLHLIINVIEKEIPEFDPAYRFKVGEKVYTLSSILESIEIKGDEIELKLIGWEALLHSYYKFIKKLKVVGKIKSIKGNFDGREWEK